MIKKAIEYVVGLASPTINEIGGRKYSDKPLHRIEYNPLAESIKFSTLTGLISYIRSGVDPFVQAMILHVESPTCVTLYSALDNDRNREHVAEARANIPCIEFGRFAEHEAFCIALQSKFLDSGDRAKLLKFAGTVEAGSVAEYGDDGITQKATIKTGIASKSDALVPSPAYLAPYRTFIEVDQPLSQFIFRMKQEHNSGNITCALFEADGGAWKMAAMENVEKFLRDNLSDIPDLIILR